MLATLVYERRRRGGGKGLATLCLGGGGAVAMSVEVYRRLTGAGVQRNRRWMKVGLFLLAALPAWGLMTTGYITRNLLWYPLGCLWALMVLAVAFKRLGLWW